MNTKPGFVYIMSNFARTTLYVGVTSDLSRRVFEHREGVFPGFTKKYNCKYLVYYEALTSIEDAIRREKQLKNWHRDWKIKLIKSANPPMSDLSDEVLAGAIH